MFDHLLQFNEDLHYLHLLLSDEDVYNELVGQNELKLAKKKYNTKLNFFIKLAKLMKKRFKYNIKYMFVYQAKESSLDINKNTDEENIKKKYEEDKGIIYKLDDIWKGPQNSNMFYIRNDYFLTIKCYRVEHDILLSPIDNFTTDLQNILRISKNQNFFSTLKE